MDRGRSSGRGPAANAWHLKNEVALGAGEGADLRAPLGRAVIGGTITSTLLTLLVVPTIYEILVGTREKVRGLFRRKSRVQLRPESEPAGAGRQ